VVVHMKSRRMKIVSIVSIWTSLVPMAALADEPVPMVRLTATEIAALAAAVPANSTGPTMTVLVGDPKLAGLYTVRVAIPAHTQVKPHTHRDNRSVTVLSGTWQMGPHFSQTTDEPVVILVTGYGPNDTKFVTP
jgi:hypothetical protein